MNGIATRPLVVLATLLLGCTAQSDVEEVKQMLSQGDPVLATPRVENGVTVYEHSADAFDKAPQWTLEAKPTATIGGADGDEQYDLTRVGYVVQLSDGRVMTFTPVGNKVFVFSRNGKGERVTGRWTATAFRQDGASLGRLTSREKTVPMAFGANQVIVRSEDENGVVSLRIYRFTNPGR